MAGFMASRRLLADSSAVTSAFTSTFTSGIAKPCASSALRQGMAASWAAPLSVGAAVTLGSQRPSHNSHSSSFVSARARSRLAS